MDKKRFFFAATAYLVAFPGLSETRGAHFFASEAQCVESHKISAQICKHAAENAAAEFSEKAPRFSTREACERGFPRGCSIGFHGAEGYAGRKSGIYFSPRQIGFRILVKSDHAASVMPIGAALPFSARNALLRDSGINPHGNREITSVRHEGVAPPPPPPDPNFDCASVLESGSDPRTGCFPAKLVGKQRPQ